MAERMTHGDRVRAELNRRPGETLKEAAARKRSRQEARRPRTVRGTEPKTASGGAGKPPAKTTKTATAGKNPSSKNLTTRGSRAVTTSKAGPKLTTAAQRASALSGFGKTAARGAGAALGPAATAGLVGSGLVKAAQDASKKVQADPDRELVRGRGQRAKASKVAAGARKGVNLGPTEQQRMLRSQSAGLTGGTPSKSKAKTSPSKPSEPKPKPKPKPKSPPKPKPESSADRRAKAIVSGTKSANKMANAKFDKAKRRTSNADKSRKLWLGH